MKLLGISNAKTPKGESAGYLTGILYLAPASLSGRNVCPYSTKGCRQACLNTAGRGTFSNVQRARLRKTKWLVADLARFVLQLQSDINKLRRMSTRRGLKPVVRLNGTSDLRWERIAPELFTDNADVMFYDYTKWPLDRRAKLPSNYHLTYSSSEETTATDMHKALLRGNVSVVVSTEEKKSVMLRDNKLQALDGDLNDLRFLDPASNYLVLLRAKGKARKDNSGFVV